MTRDGPRGESPREEAPPTSAVGARLREAREKRGLSEEAASREAGLPLRYLKMLEEGRFPTVADPAYLTHFLQRYARFLGLDPGATTRSFLQETEPETASRRASRAPMAGRPPLLAHPGRQAVGRNLLVSGALLAAAIGGVFAFVRSRQEPEGVAVASLSRGAPQAARNVTRQPAGSFEDMPASRSAKELPAAPARGGDLLGTSTRPPSVAAAPAPAASAANPRSEAPRAAASLPAELSAPSGPVSPSGSPDALAASPRATSPAEPARPAGSERVVPPGPFELRIVATARQVWVWASVDGGPRRAVSLNRGESVAFRATERCVLSLDDAGGVEATLDGKRLPRFGRPGQARRNIVVPSAEFGLGSTSGDA